MPQGLRLAVHFDARSRAFDVLPLKMSPRPLHRWKSFWLGLLVLIFLGWAWQRSIRHLDSFGIANSAGSVGGLVYQRDSTVILTAPGTMRILPGTRLFTILLPYPRNYPLIPPPLSVGRNASQPYHTIIIAHWLLVLLFFVPWVGFLLWRVRRMRRLAGSSTKDPAP